MRDELGRFSLSADDLERTITILTAERLVDAATDGKDRVFTVRDRDVLRALLSAIVPQHSVRRMAMLHHITVRNYVLAMPEGARGTVDPDVDACVKTLAGNSAKLH